MQMFIVYANKAADFTIPKSRRKHGNVSFLRSATENRPDNELLLEVTDSQTKGFDRACVVFRPGAGKESANDRYDASKLFNRSGGVSQIWFPTGAPANKSLSVSVVADETADLEVSWLPASIHQQCTIRAYRQESLTAPRQVVLLDRQTGVETDLLETPEYTFDSDPSDRTNRFALLFKPSPTGLEDKTGSELACYYNKTGKSVGIINSTEADARSTVAIYDVQGRIILQTLVGNGIIPFAASEGIYIVKVSGRRMLNSKIVVK
jgi:hypothetical protein